MLKKLSFLIAVFSSFSFSLVRAQTAFMPAYQGASGPVPVSNPLPIQPD